MHNCTNHHKEEMLEVLLVYWKVNCVKLIITRQLLYIYFSFFSFVIFILKTLLSSKNFFFFSVQRTVRLLLVTRTPVCNILIIISPVLTFNLVYLSYYNSGLTIKRGALWHISKLFYEGRKFPSNFQVGCRPCNSICIL